MAEPITFTDLEFHFTSGQRVRVTAQVGRDTIDRAPGGRITRVTCVESDTLTSTLEIYGPLDAVELTHRIEQPDWRPDDLAAHGSVLTDRPA